MSCMKLRPLGRSSLRVSEIGFGAWAIGTNWWAENSQETELKMLETALEAGINFFDTSNVYGDGKSERILGAFLHGRREDVVISSKFGYDIDAERVGGMHSERPQRFSPEYLRASLKRSLANLQTDYLDLYELHNPKMSAIENDELFEELDRLVDENAIRSYGIALGPAIGWKEEGLKAIRERGICAVQTVYNALEQDPGNALFSECTAHGVSGLVRVPHASGALDERYDPGEKLRSDDHRNYRLKKWLEDMRPYTIMLKELAESKDMSLTQLAISFSLSNQAVASVLPTFTGIEDIELFVSDRSMRLLSAAEMGRINSIYDEARRVAESAATTT